MTIEYTNDGNVAVTRIAESIEELIRDQVLEAYRTGYAEGYKEGVKQIIKFQVDKDTETLFIKRGE